MLAIFFPAVMQQRYDIITAFQGAFPPVLVCGVSGGVCVCV